MKKKKKKGQPLFVGKEQPYNRWEKDGTWESRSVRVRNKIDLLLQNSYRSFVNATGHEPLGDEVVCVVEPVLSHVWSHGVNIDEYEVYDRYERLQKGLRSIYTNAVGTGNIPEVEVCTQRYRQYRNDEIPDALLKQEDCFLIRTPEESFLMEPVMGGAEDLWAVLKSCPSGAHAAKVLKMKMADVNTKKMSVCFIQFGNIYYLFVKEAQLDALISHLIRNDCCVLMPPEEQMPDNTYETSM